MMPFARKTSMRNEYFPEKSISLNWMTSSRNNNSHAIPVTVCASVPSLVSSYRNDNLKGFVQIVKKEF